MSDAASMRHVFLTPSMRRHRRFCGLSKDEAATADGDGVTPLSSALDFAGAERLTLAGTTIHAAKLPSFLSPELAESDAPWYGDEARIDEWARFLEDSD